MQKIDTFKIYLKERQVEKGTYIAWRYSEDTLRNLEIWLLNNDIPNPIEKEKIHSTVIYSRVQLDIEPKGKFFGNEYAQTNRLGTFDTQDGKRALIWFIDCPAMVDRHNYIMETTAATYDYDKFQPHITFSYDIPENYDVDKLTIHGLPLILTLVSEYKEDLDWV